MNLISTKVTLDSRCPCCWNMKAGRNIILIWTNKDMVLPYDDMIVVYWNTINKCFHKAFPIKPMRIQSISCPTIIERLSIPFPKKVGIAYSNVKEVEEVRMLIVH